MFRAPSVSSSPREVKRLASAQLGRGAIRTNSAIATGFISLSASHWIRGARSLALNQEIGKALAYEPGEPGRKRPNK